MLILEDLDINVYLLVNQRKFSLGVEFNDNLIEIISSKIESAYRFNFNFTDITSLIVERYLLIYTFSIANINIKKY